MHRQRLATGLTVAFAAMSALLAVAGILGNPIALVVALVFAGVAALLWYDASGRLASRIYRRVEQRAAVGGSGTRSSGDRGGFGAGPREDWDGPHQRRGRRRNQRARTSNGVRGQRGAVNAPDDGPLTAKQAYDVLDLEVGADDETVRAAYRDRIKDVHPDTPDGDEAAFRRVRSAYERLSD